MVRLKKGLNTSYDVTKPFCDTQCHEADEHAHYHV